MPPINTHMPASASAWPWVFSNSLLLSVGMFIYRKSGLLTACIYTPLISLSQIMMRMFGSASILSFWALHTLTKRQVAIKQGAVPALLGLGHNELNGFHDTVIIANPDFCVKKKPRNPGLGQFKPKYYLVLLP
jgi:hypothetical protein